ncbi:MAG: tRNA-dihydrouridine synthase family protein [Breznakibacter sp.]
MQLYSAPLQSYTTVFYRAAFHECIGRFDKYFTPFFELAKTEEFVPKLFPELDLHLNRSMYVVPQILTNESLHLVRFAKTANDLGFREINLNMGCPHPPIWRKGLGSGLIQSPKMLDKMLTSFFNQMPDCLLSVKMRLGVEDAHEWEKLAPVLNDHPLLEVIVHPRTARQQYKGVPDWDEFARIANTLTHRMVANGNIESAAHLAHLKAHVPNISCVMVGRGWLGNPWLPNMLKNIPVNQGNMSQLKEFHQKFHILVTENVNDVNIRRNLFHAFWFYVCGQIDGGKRWYRSLTKERSLDSYPALVEQLLKRDWVGIPVSES